MGILSSPNREPCQFLRVCKIIGNDLDIAVSATKHVLGSNNLTGTRFAVMVLSRAYRKIQDNMLRTTNAH